MSNPTKMKGAIQNGMSLFQDLKLKRRKVDSRCSSDGESIGTSDSAASLSPEAQTQLSEGGSPKDKDRCVTPEELSNGKFGPKYFFVLDTKSNGRSGYDAFSNNNNNNNNNSISKNNNNTIPNGVLKLKREVIEEEEEERHHGTVLNDDDNKSDSGVPSSGPASPDKPRLIIDESVGAGTATPSPKNGSSSDTESIGSQASTTSSGRSSNGGMSSASSTSSSTKRKRERDDIVIGTTKVVKSEVPLAAVHQKEIMIGGSKYVPRSAPSSPPSLILTKSSPSPPNTATGAIGGPNGYHQHMHHLSEGGHYRMGSSPSPPHGHHHAAFGMLSAGYGPHGLVPHPSAIAHLLPPHSHLHSRLTQGNPNGSSDRSINVASPLAHVEIRNLAEKSHSVVTSTSLSFPHHSAYRINGVRPEVISGGAVTGGGSSNNANGATSATNSTNGSSTPVHPGSGSPIGGNSPSRYTNLGVSSGMPNNSSPFAHRKSPQHHPVSAASPASSHHSQSSNSSSPSNSAMHSPGSTNGSTIVAGGSLGGANGQAAGHHHVNLNRTPTVIMGEAGGVRTMLWSQPGQQMPNSPPTMVDLGHVGSPMGPASNASSTSSTSSSSGYGHSRSSSTSPPHNPTMATPNGHTKGVLSMQELWASEALNLSTSPNSSNSTTSNSNSGNNNNNNSNGHAAKSHNQTNGHGHHEDDEYEQPMICMICEDRATGLHYGIITCEGCKGFFKRTVQNRRVYTCVADGTCEITKAQRNRCQYCRFKKCIEQGMVLQAVREDRMPGGRNSGAVYNLYKVPVKYRKHKKGNRATAVKVEKGATNGHSQQQQQQNNNVQQQHHQQIHHHQQQPPIIQSGNILLTALTNPNEVTHLRQQQSHVYEHAVSNIAKLVQCDNFHDIAAYKNWDDLLEGRGELSEKLLKMGDSIVMRLVQWTKRLPFYDEVPQEVITFVLTQKWHELLVLTTSAWHAMHTPGPPLNVTAEEEAAEGLHNLQRCLGALMGSNVTSEQLRQDVGEMVDRLTLLTRTFRRMNIRVEEFVCLKVISMLQGTGSKSPDVMAIQDRYLSYLRTFLQVTSPNQPNRLHELLKTLQDVQASARLLLDSKMFYVPFLLNSSLLQR